MLSLRRSAQIASVAALTALGFTLQPVLAVGAGPVATVEQITDHTAAVASKIFRFEPEVLVLEPGDTVRFLNSVGAHTVKSSRGLWPEGAETVDVKGEAMADVIFAVSGLYGITCARHGRYGMSMLIAVGDAGKEAVQTFDANEIDASALARAAYARHAASLLAQIQGHGE